MVDPATTDHTDHLPAVLDTHEVAAALNQSLYRTQHQLRTGMLAGGECLSRFAHICSCG
jgi:hypothetical protein